MSEQAELLIHVSVTRDHIRNGERGEVCYCPVALAILAALPAAAVKADYESIDIDGRRYETPERVEEFMRKFDVCRKKSAQRPFNFELPAAG